MPPPKKGAKSGAGGDSAADAAAAEVRVAAARASSLMNALADRSTRVIAAERAAVDARAAVVRLEGSLAQSEEDKRDLAAAMTRAQESLVAALQAKNAALEGAIEGLTEQLGACGV